jgi:endonuclease I
MNLTRPLAARTVRSSLLLAVALATPTLAQVDPFDAGNYYDNVSGTGAALKNSIEQRLKSGHFQTTYGTARYALKFTDEDPDQPGNVLLVYNRISTDGDWQDALFATREHVWPRSRLGTNGSNSTAGRFGDLHMLKPSDQSTNSNRGNDSFGTVNTTGGNRGVGEFYYPGDVDAGDMARIAFYAATRWQDDGLELVNGAGSASSRQMGDLASLLRYHYRDTPDTFERNRNQIIYDFYTSNRNAYIDRPEYVWSVFADQENDTQLTLAGSTASADGSSELSIDFGKRIVGTEGPSSLPLILDKSGVDGTYYSVTSTGNASSSLEGRYNAFEMDSAGSTFLDVSLETNGIGSYSGTVVVDNLDVTTQGGTGRGANDGNDVVSLFSTIVAPSNASFSSTNDNEALTLDLGIVGRDLGVVGQAFDIFNFDNNGVGSDLVAGLDFDGFEIVSGDQAAFDVDGDFSNAAADGIKQSLVVRLLDDALGSFSADIALFFSDADDVAGGSAAGIGDGLGLFVTGEVRVGGDADGDGEVSLADFTILRNGFGQDGLGFVGGDFDNDGTVSLADFTILRNNFGTAGDLAVLDAWRATVPEPTSLTLLALGGLFLRRRR